MVSKLKRRSLLTSLSLLFTLTSVLTAQSVNVKPTPENWKQTATTISQADATGHKDVVREERSSLFNARTPDVRKLDSSDPNRQVVETSFPPQFVRIPAIPVQESDAVIIGTVASVQPYFSTDHTHIYTEFTVKVDQQFKDTAQRAPSGGTVPIVIQGGALRLADGRVVQEKVVKTNFTIAVGSRYVFFLHYVPKGQYFNINKSWELKDGVTIPTSSADQLDAQQGRSRFAGVAEPEFISAVKGAASSGQDQQ